MWLLLHVQHVDCSLHLTMLFETFGYSFQKPPLDLPLMHLYTFIPGHPLWCIVHPPHPLYSPLVGLNYLQCISRIHLHISTPSITLWEQRVGGVGVGKHCLGLQ